MKLKRIFTTVALLGALVLSQTAAADSRHHRWGFSSYGFGNHYSHYNPYHFGSSFGYGGFSYGSRHHRNRRHSTGSFVGGLLLGSLLSYPSYSRRSYERVRPAREIVYVQKSTPRSNTTVVTGRRLLRDLEGNCFERNIDERGNEIRV